jgi:preprotein translocase subunit SecF
MSESTNKNAPTSPSGLHKFRYLLPPGSNFQFVSRFKMFVAVSFVLVGLCFVALFANKATRGAYLNWTIDFKGGTEVIFSFKQKADPTKYAKVDSGTIRAALKSAGEDGFDVSDMAWSQIKADGNNETVQGIIVRTPRFEAVNVDQEKNASTAFTAKFSDRQIIKLNWSGGHLYVRSKAKIANAETADIFKSAGLNLKPWSTSEAIAYSTADEGTAEFTQIFSMWGLDFQLGQAIEKADPDVTAVAVNSYGVGAKAGDKLRDDAIKSMVYAILLIMLYLAFRFDIRYAPGAAFATIHDAIMVVGVFAVTWTEVSLTTVAALLTVIGYSVNDTVIIFDRIRENQVRLKDKTLERIIDISINETLVRSILTSLTVFATTLLMNLFGDGLVRNFAFAMNVGVVVGTYSSIFLASPIFYWISTKWYSGPVKVRSGAARGAAVSAEP